MARTDLPAATVLSSTAQLNLAVAPPTAAFVDGHMFVNNGRRLLRVQNTNAATRDVEIQFKAAAMDGASPLDRIYTIPVTTGHALLGPWSPNVYNQPDGKVYIDYSATAGLVVEVLELKAV